MVWVVFALCLVVVGLAAGLVVTVLEADQLRERCKDLVEDKTALSEQVADLEADKFRLETELGATRAQLESQRETARLLAALGEVPAEAVKEQ